MSDISEVTRRELLRLAGGAVAAAHLPALRAAAAEPELRFFTREEYALADVLCELIIPADAQSGGARAAGVPLFIDGALADAFTEEPRAIWRAGLASVDALARRSHRVPFVQTAPAEQIAILHRLAAGEEEPASDEERFFVELKRRTVHAYYTSRIGIHDDMQYKGNVMLQEFAGIDVSRQD